MDKTTKSNDKRLIAYARMLGAAIGFCAAIYWFVIGEKAPDYNTVLREYS